MLKEAEWIWQNRDNRADEYVYFYDTLEGAGEAVLHISCDSDYALYINGGLAAFGQYADYPHYKVYDSVDISAFLKDGANELVFLVWYCGYNSMTYTRGNAGLIYSVTRGGKSVLSSRAGVPCRVATDYVNYQCKTITVQLGLGYAYDTRRSEENFPSPSGGTTGAVAVAGIKGGLYLRPNKKTLRNPGITYGTAVDKDRLLYDCGEEVAGFLCIKFTAPEGAEVTVSYGEHIADGGVRRKIGDRDFSVRLIASGRAAEFEGTFRRLSCRYLQVECAGEISIEYIGIRETPYPLAVRPFNAGEGLRQRIYDTSARTLRLCMHEHYEDTPWREQALYSMDGRNQMLCGYYAFGEYEFPRSNLLLMAKGVKSEDNLLPICFPAGNDVPIPFFSLMYVVSLREYGEHSGDWEFVKTVLPVAEGIVRAFLDRRDESGLVPELAGYWNFYEWSDGLDGMTDGDFILKEANGRYALALNCFLILALENLDAIYTGLLEVGTVSGGAAANLRKTVHDTFFVPATGLFKNFSEGESYSQLGNALAVLTGCAAETERGICEKLISKDGGMTGATLSMRSFVYDALLKCAPEYSEFILKEIDRDYGYMISCGATSFWETIKGEADFGNAGSLCHGWSAIPVYYYHKLLPR